MARNPFLELGLPCTGEPSYYLVQRMERLGFDSWSSAAGIAVLFGAQDDAKEMQEPFTPKAPRV